MAKIFLFSLFFCALQTGFTPIFVANGHASFESVPQKMNGCDAPAPDSFLVTSSASDLVTLGWIPAWAGAIHTLELSIEESGMFVALFTNYNVPGDSYTLNNLEPGYYRARIATNCSSGETSFKVSEVLFLFKIIDLTTSGRIPKSPTPVEDCANIDYLNYEWIGFSVTEITSGQSNLFEFKFSEGEYPAIKRVFYYHRIVAVDKDGVFPTNLNPQLKTPSPFQMDDLVDENPNNLINIGYILCRDNFSSPPTITLCKHEENPPIEWKPEYKFQALIATSILTTNDPAQSGDKTWINSTDFNKFKAESPFKTSLTIFSPNLRANCKKTSVSLLNLNGQKLLEYNFDLNTPQFSLPVASLLPGIYYLQIKTDCESQTLKVVKSE